MGHQVGPRLDCGWKVLPILPGTSFVQVPDVYEVECTPSAKLLLLDP